MLIKKKEIIAAALVVLIGCAGYLNWSYQDTMTVNDGESYIETGRRLGEAQLVNSETEVEDTTEDKAEAAVDNAKNENNNGEKEEPKEMVIETKSDNDGTYFETAKYERENARSKAIEILNQTCSNESFDETTRRKAGDKIISETDNINCEQEIESIAKSKGYNEICAHVSGESATVAVRKDDFGSEDAMVLSELVQQQSGLSSNNIKIVEIK